MDIKIKPLSSNSKDINQVQAFLFEMIKNEFGYGYVPEWHQDIVNMEEFYINPEQNNFFVAYNETGEIIATIGIRAYDKNFPMFKQVYSKETTSSIWRLYVDNRYRRCGLASKLFSIAEDFAKELKYDEIYLHTHKTLDGALEFWTKMGFTVVLDACDELETVHMDKKLHCIEISQLSADFSYAVEF